MPATNPTAAALARLLSTDAGYTYGNVLPLAKNNTTGALSPAMPGMVRSGLQGLADAVTKGIPDLVNMRTAPSAQPGVNTLTPDSLGALMGMPAAGVAPAGAVASGAVRRAALPMDEASRMARAAEQGYSGADWFRGVSGDHGIRPNSMWTNDPREAGAYARGSALTNTGEAANIIPAKIRGAKGRNIDDEVMDALEAGDNPDVVAAQIMKDESLDYVEFYHPSTMGDDHLVRVVADPKNIRSRFAAFDPAKKDSTDLLASRSPGYPLAWQQQPQDQRRVELARALSKVQK